MLSKLACICTGREFNEPCMPGCYLSAHCPSGGLIGLPTTLHRLASSVGTTPGRPTGAVFRSPAQNTSQVERQADQGHLAQHGHSKQGTAPSHGMTGSATMLYNSYAAPEMDALAGSGPLGVGGFLGRLAFWKPLFCWAAPKLGSSSTSGRAGDRHMSISGTLSFPAFRCSMHSTLS